MNLLRHLNRSLSATILFNIALLALWLVSVFWLTSAEQKNYSEITIFNTIPLFSLPYFWSAAVQLVCFCLMAFLAHQIIFINYLTITTYLPFSIMMLFGTICKEAQLFENNTITTFFFMAAIWQFLKIGSKKNYAAIVFNTMFLLVAGTFFSQYFAWLIPVFIFGFIYFIGLNFKLLMAILFSVSMPLLCFLGVCFLSDNLPLFTEYFSQFYDFTFNAQLNFSLNCYLVMGISIIFSLISLFFYFNSKKSHKQRIRLLVVFLIVLWLAMLILTAFLKHQTISFCEFYIILISFFISLNFTNLQSKRNSIIFLILLLLSLATYAAPFFNKI